MFKQLLTGLMAALAIAGVPAMAADPAPDTKMSDEEILASLKFQHGKIELPDGIATLDLPPSFRYLGAADAGRVLAAWGNPPDNSTLGMIFPDTVSPMSNAGWGVIITYDKDGHVKDDDADSINYTDLLKDMQKGTEEASAERKKQGYAPMTLVGWAEPPRYDKATHKYYWAKELAGENPSSGPHSLNYNIRVLGREGVLVLNAVAGMEQIGTIKSEMQKVVAFTDFTKGKGYDDFDAKTDKVAEYGLAALVAGGVAAKLGLFGKIFALLLGAKKILAVAFIALGSSIAKFFGRKKSDDAQ